jgi:hypothetical protein
MVTTSLLKKKTTIEGGQCKEVVTTPSLKKKKTTIEKGYARRW